MAVSLSSHSYGGCVTEQLALLLWFVRSLVVALTDGRDAAVAVARSFYGSVPSGYFALSFSPSLPSSLSQKWRRKQSVLYQLRGRCGGSGDAGVKNGLFIRRHKRDRREREEMERREGRQRQKRCLPSAIVAAEEALEREEEA